MTTYNHASSDKDLVHQAKEKMSHAWKDTKQGLIKAAEIVVEVAGDFKDEAKKAIVGADEPEVEQKTGQGTLLSLHNRSKRRNSLVVVTELPADGPPNVLSQSARMSMEQEAAYCL